MIGIRRRIAWALAPLWLAAAAIAHPIVIHSGSVEWENRTLRVTLALDEHAFEHEIEALGRTLAPEQVARALVRSIHVTSHECALIEPVQIIVREDGNIATCDYDIPEGTTALALVHRPGTELGALSRQFQIVRHSPTARYASTIRLTSRGNHAVLRPGSATEQGSAAGEAFVQPVLRIAADDARSPQIQIDYPCTLLATWPDLIHRSNGAITGESFQHDQPGIAEWANEHLAISGRNGAPGTTQVEQVNLIAPSGEILTHAQDRRFSTYTTRVRVRAASGSPGAFPWTDIRWKGFNHAILSVPVVFESDGVARCIGILTPVQPAVRIHHANPPCAMIRPATTPDAIGVSRAHAHEHGETSAPHFERITFTPLTPAPLSKGLGCGALRSGPVIWKVMETTNTTAKGIE